MDEKRRKRRLEFMGHAADKEPLPLGGFHKLSDARFHSLRHQVKIPRKRAYLVSRMHIGPHGIIAARNLPRRFRKGGQRPCAAAHEQRNAARTKKYACEAYGGERPRHSCNTIVGCGNVLYHVHGIGCASHHDKASHNEHIAPLDLPLRKLGAVFAFRQRQQCAWVNRNAGTEGFFPAHQNGGGVRKPGKAVVDERGFHFH